MATSNPRRARRRAAIADVAKVLAAFVVAVWWLRSWRATAAGALAMAFVYAGLPGVAAVVLAPFLVLLLIRWRSPDEWVRVRQRVIGAWRHCTRYARLWRRIKDACGLSTNRRDGTTLLPVLRRVLATAGGDLLDIPLLPGQTSDVYLRAAEPIAQAWGVHAVRVTCPKRGWVRLRVLRHNPFTYPIVLNSVPAAMNLHEVPYAVGEDGCWRTRSYANISAEIGGGVPGSGKTAGETSLACALIQNPAVQYVVVDGKGGQDWTWINPRAAAYCPEDDNLPAVLAVVEQVHALMRHRLATQLSVRGDSNFWNLPLDPSHPAVFLLVDEVQTFTDVKGMRREDREVAMQITARLATLVKKGRSAGIVTKLLTQKPTADAIPTTIRDNAPVRTCWRVMTREAAHAVLGDTLTTSTLNPVEIPASLPGLAVVATDTAAELEQVRYPYLHETHAATIAQQTAHLRQPLIIPGDLREVAA